jgi:hypothetical protein
LLELNYYGVFGREQSQKNGILVAVVVQDEAGERFKPMGNREWWKKEAAETRQLMAQLE